MNTSKAKNGMFNPSTGFREPVVAANRCKLILSKSPMNSSVKGLAE